MPKSINARVFDGIVKMESYLLRYTEKQAAAIAKATLAAMDVAKTVRDAAEMKDKRRYGIVYNRLKEMYTAASERATKAYSATSLELSEMVVSKTASLIEDAIPFKFSMRTPTPDQVLVAVMKQPMTEQGWFVANSMAQWGEGAARNIAKTISDGYLVGMTAQEVTDRIIGQSAFRFRDGAIETQTISLTRIVRTALQHTEGVARTLLYESNEDVIKNIQWVATLDANTCMKCAMYDGQVFDIGKAMEPPLHWNCRCTTVPVLKSWEELGAKFDPGDMSEETRASMDGQVSAKITYAEWIKQKEADEPGFARGPMGPAKYELFKAGKWNPGTFDPKDNAYSVAQIKAMLSK